MAASDPEQKFMPALVRRATRAIDHAYPPDADVLLRVHPKREPFAVVDRGEQPIG